MTAYAYRILNVFARAGRLTGNPLCVFEDGDGISDDDMQALARQFNLSETTFVLPSSRRPRACASSRRRTRCRSPGHPTLGTAHVVRDLRRGGDAADARDEGGRHPACTRPAIAGPCRRTRRDGRAVGIRARELAEILGPRGRATWANGRCGISSGREQLHGPADERARRYGARARKPDAFSRLKSEDGARHGLSCSSTPARRARSRRASSSRAGRRSSRIRRPARRARTSAAGSP